MAWFAVSSEFHCHPATADISPNATALWTLSGSWSAGHTAGSIEKVVVAREAFGNSFAVDELLRAGLWVDDGDRYSFALEGELWRIVEPRGKLPRRQVFERDGWRCAYCASPVDLQSGHVDHVFPRSRGGSDELENLAAACAPCNLNKGARTPEEWRS